MSDAILFIYRKSQTMADGALRMVIDIEPRDAQTAFALFHEPGASGAIVRITDEAAQEALQATNGAEGITTPRADEEDAAQRRTAPYGDHARALRLSSFFRTPDVWRAVGSDADFLAWLRTQKCAARPGCAGDIVPAHVRRVANGAGTGVKPPYSAIALCDGHHRQQHQHGESALGGRDWFDRQRIAHVQRWCWERLKRELGYDTWAEVPPHKLYVWAQFHDVEKLLPACYLEMPA
jgi:hypothetical protein